MCILRVQRKFWIRSKENLCHRKKKIIKPIDLLDFKKINGYDCIELNGHL